MNSEPETHEYAFDVKLYAVVRIRAASRKIAERVLEEALDCASLNVILEHEEGKALITEASTHVDDVEFPYLFEYDGRDVEAEEIDVK
jgi:hypothetical protein